MSDNIWVSFRNPDGRTFTIGGSSPDNFFDNATGMLGDGEKAQRLVEDFAVLLDPPSLAPSQPAAPSAPAAARQAAPSTPPAPGAPSCAHGARVYRTGTGSKGQWAAWFCPTPKGAPDQCKAEWA